MFYNHVYGTYCTEQKDSRGNQYCIMQQSYNRASFKQTKVGYCQIKDCCRVILFCLSEQVTCYHEFLSSNFPLHFSFLSYQFFFQWWFTPLSLKWYLNPNQHDWGSKAIPDRPSGVSLHAVLKPQPSSVYTVQRTTASTTAIQSTLASLIGRFASARIQIMLTREGGQS